MNGYCAQQEYLGKQHLVTAGNLTGKDVAFWLPFSSQGSVAEFPPPPPPKSERDYYKGRLGSQSFKNSLIFGHIFSKCTVGNDFTIISSHEINPS